MATDFTPDDLISLSEKLSALELSDGEAVVLAIALARGGDEVTGFTSAPPRLPGEFAPLLFEAVEPYTARGFERWIELSAQMRP